MIVGYINKEYPEIRNIINKSALVNYVKVSNYKLIIINILKKYSGSLFKKTELSSKDRRFYFNDLNLNKVDIIHLFNKISYGKTPWITTFESILPRSKVSHKLLNSHNNDNSDLINDKALIDALSMLAGKSCKKIIALSRCNLNMQKTFLLHFPEYYKIITSKLVCLHPPQKLLVNSWEDKSLSLIDGIHFVFIGGQFFGKGGREILEVFRDLRKNQGYHLKLSIISSLTPDTYASNTSETDVKLAKGIIDDNKEWIDYYKQLPNTEVLKLMKSAHIGLLPTYADTYGYSVLEFQASGCPVITTNIRALPEINNDDVGWLIPVRKHSTGEGYYASSDEREAMSNLIKNGLHKAIVDIMENKQLIIEKSSKALKHIKDNHSPKVFSDKLTKIYYTI